MNGSQHVSRRQRREIARRQAKAAKRTRRIVLASGVVMTIGTGGVVIPALPAAAATFTVTSAADAGVGSLRQAITDANAAAGADTILFDPAVTAITLTTGELPIITDSLTITGPGEGNLTITGANTGPNQGRIFNIENTGSATPIDVAITGLTVTGGKAADGGGIRAVDENLTLDHLNVNTNEDTGAGGGGVFFNGSSAVLHITNSTISNNISAASGGGLKINGANDTVDIATDTFSGNTAAQNGGGIDAQVTLPLPGSTFNVVASTISGNTGGTSTGLVTPGHGGGINIDGSYSAGAIPVHIVASSISGNTADPDVGGVGGGVMFTGLDNTNRFLDAAITLSTISGNSAAAGGGVYEYYAGDVGTPTLIQNTTIAGNTASANDGGGLGSDFSFTRVEGTTISGNSAAAGSGGGVATNDAGSVDLHDSIVANDTAATNPDVNIGATTTVTANYTLIETPNAGITGANNATGDPGLGSLVVDPGSATATLKPAWSSPVVNTGDPASLLTLDQRQRPRPGGARVDMGSVELQPTVLDFTNATTSVAENTPTGNVNLQVTRTGGDGPVDANFVNVDGTAKSTASGIGTPDYSVATVSPLHWNDNDTAPQNIVVNINDDPFYEGNENFSVTLSAPPTPPATNAPLSITPNATETVTITENDPQPTLSIGNVSKDEGDTGTTNFDFPVTLSSSAGTALPVTVSYGTSNGTATSADYTGTSGTLTFTPAASSQTQNVTVSVATDTKHEPNETFFVTLSTPTNATITTAKATGTIVNDDPFSDSYWLAASDGGVFSFGNAGFFGSLGSKHLNQPIIAIAPTATRQGYWLLASDGGVFSFGDANFFGSLGAQPLNKPIVGMTPTPSGNGYWLVAADGGIFTFGDAGFFGSEGGRVLTSPVVGMASTPSGNGYWLVAADGGVFAHGDAGFFGSKGSTKLNSPVIGIMATPSGKGYWLFAADGGIFSFGDAKFLGSAGGQHLNQPIVGATRLADGTGYWLVARDGGVFTYGQAEFAGSAAAIQGHAPIVGMARA